MPGTQQGIFGHTDLIAGPYTPPSLKKGEHTTCLFRDCDVVITSWTDARIPWPRCRALHLSGGSGVLVTEELVRALRTEAAVAITHWFGLSNKSQIGIRKALGITELSEGSLRLLRAASQMGADVMKAKEYTPGRRRAKATDRPEARHQTTIGCMLGRQAMDVQVRKSPGVFGGCPRRTA